jgi:hypothetical protein
VSKPILVYVAGPFTGRPPSWVPDWTPNVVKRWLTRRDTQRNIRAAVDAGFELATNGFGPLIPHSMLRDQRFSDMQVPLFWRDVVDEMLRRSDLVLVLPSWKRSGSTMRQYKLAMRLGMPTFLDVPSAVLYREHQIEKQRRAAAERDDS